MNAAPSSVTLLGSRIHTLPKGEVVRRMVSWIESREAGSRPRQVIVTGFHGIWEAHKDPELRTILNGADLWVPDGIAPVFLARLKGHPRAIERVPGAELMQAFFEAANPKGFRSFFYGDTEKTLARLKGKLETAYPGHRIAGVFSPPFRKLTEKEDADVIRMINDARPDVLWVALGMPRQDRWIHERLDRLRVPVAVGVGAAFAFLSGDVKRVPHRIGAMGLEWLWRLAMEPRKLWRRDLVDGPGFLWHATLELLRERCLKRPEKGAGKGNRLEAPADIARKGRP